MVSLLFSDVYSIDVFDPCWNDVNVFAGALKLYLRELPEPVFTYHLYQDFIQAGSEFYLMHTLVSLGTRPFTFLSMRSQTTSLKGCDVLVSHNSQKVPSLESWILFKLLLERSPWCQCFILLAAYRLLIL